MNIAARQHFTISTIFEGAIAGINIAARQHFTISTIFEGAIAGINIAARQHFAYPLLFKVFRLSQKLISASSKENKPLKPPALLIQPVSRFFS
ncbi:hypothetical protein C0389_01925 [bacterium]|nr:hypothetical protein [bacterium]